MTVAALLMLLASPVIGAAQAAPDGCDQATSTTDVLAALQQAEAAYASADLAALQAAQQSAQTALPCVADTLSSSLVARFHRTMGLAEFVAGQPERAARAFAGARAIEPTYSFPDEIVPAGNPVLDHYTAIGVERPLLTTLEPPPADGRLLVQGSTATTRARSWPVIAQVLAEDGSVTATAWVWPEDSLPDYPRALPGHPVTSAELAQAGGHDLAATTPTRRNKLPWIVGTAACAATSATLFAVSRGAAGTYRDPETTGEDELDRLRSTANGTLYASAGVAVATVAMGVVTLTF